MDKMKPKVRSLTEGHKIITGDCLDVLKQYPDDSVDLVITSPPYEDARSYGFGFSLKGQDWVDWSVERFAECYRISRGLVAWNVQGKTRNFQWSATPALLAADLHRRGIKLRNPAIFHRVGIPGSGGPDWFCSDYEWIICASKGKLPWSDNTACGHPPKWAPGGAMSHRLSDGARVNQWGHSVNSGATVVDDGGVVRSSGRRPSHVESSGKIAEMIRNGQCDKKVEAWIGKELPPGATFHTKSDANGDTVQLYIPPVKANPGNVLSLKVGGGLMGSKLAHENEAPFPESLPEFFIKSCCPPGGIVLDPFGGSGTTLAAAVMNGRIAHCIDIRESQADLMHRRYVEAKDRLFRTVPVQS